MSIFIGSKSKGFTAKSAKDTKRTESKGGVRWSGASAWEMNISERMDSKPAKEYPRFYPLPFRGEGWIWLISLLCASPEAGEDVATIGCHEVAPGVPQHPAAGGPRSAAQCFAGFEPGLRILFVGIRCEVGVWEKGARGPFPDVADHLTTMGNTVPVGIGSDVDGATTGPISVRIVRRCVYAPGIHSFG